MIEEAHAQIQPPGPWTGENPVAAFGQVVSLTFQVILIVAVLYAFLQIIFAGYGMISSGGDKGALEQARGKILWSIVGIVIVAASWGMILLVQHLLGVCLGFGCSLSLGA